MRMSTKGRYAINALVDLALRQGSGPVALATVSARQRVSLSYLEQLFSRLRRDGIVESTRGPGGGYTLARDVAAISVADVVRAVEDPIDAEESEADGLSRALWQRLNTQMLGIMATIALKELVDEQLAAGATVEERPVKRNATAAQPRTQRAAVPNSVFALARSLVRQGG